MPKLFVSFLCFILWTAPGWSEPVPPPANEDVRHYISVPKAGLRDFFKWHPMRVPLVSHHRGGPVPGYPENAIEALDNVLKYGPGLMEIDVAELADGTLILMHDDTLDRTTTGSGPIADKTWHEIKGLKLIDNEGDVTDFHIPRLEDVLDWAKGKAILTLDIKPGTSFRKVADAVIATGTQDYVTAIAYTLKQAEAFHAAAPNMPISITMRNAEEIAAVVASKIPADRVIAWTGTSALPAAHYKSLHGKGWRVIMGTLGARETSIDSQIAANDNDAQYLDYYKMGVDVIATDRFWAVQSQIRNPNQYFYILSKSKAAGQH